MRVCEGCPLEAWFYANHPDNWERDDREQEIKNRRKLANDARIRERADRTPCGMPQCGKLATQTMFARFTRWEPRRTKLRRVNICGQHYESRSGRTAYVDRVKPGSIQPINTGVRLVTADKFRDGLSEAG